MSSSTHTVAAARLRAPGEPLVVEEVELPDPGPDEVYVSLAFAGVNPVDMYVAAGRVAPDGPLPRTLGAEASGHLDGRAVFVGGGGLGSARDGVWASGAVVPRASVATIPEGVDLRAAAAMGIAGVTAWKVVHDVAGVQAHDRVLVLGASGGVGSMIVPLVRAAGATVWGQTGSESKAAFVRGQGAERAVVCDAEGLAAAVAELEPTAIFDPLGGDFLEPAVSALATRGRITSLGTSAGAEVRFNLQALYRKSGSIRGYGGMQLSAAERAEGVRCALQALQKGDLRVHVDAALPLERVEDAFQRIRDRGVLGKLLLEVGADRRLS